MFFFPSILLSLFTISLWASTTIVTQISEIDTGEMHEEILVFLKNGQVAKIYPTGISLLERTHRAKDEDAWVKVKLNDKREILSLRLIPPPYYPSQVKFSLNLEDYTPSILASFDEAVQLLRESRMNHKESQCYNRAHVWAYEWRAKHQLYTSKVWLFFTRRYIRKFNFGWWFHVSPYFHVQDGDKVWERVADVKYARTPLKLKQWSDIFLRNDAECPIVTSYSHWANYPETGWCYMMKSSMYYYQPLDLEILEKDGVNRQVWDPSEVMQAYKEAFDIDV